MTSLTKYLPLTLLQGFERGYSRFACERELETEHKLQYFDLPLLWPSRCVFLVLLMLNRRSRGPLCWVMTYFTESYQHLLRTSNHPDPKAPSAWCGFPYHILFYPSPTQLNCHLTSVLTELYNSSTPTRSPTRSLKSHVWSSSSGNNCHAVHRSLPSGASLCSGTVGPSPCSILSALIRPRDLFRLLAIGMSHFLPVHHLRMAFLGRVEGQNITKRYD